MVNDVIQQIELLGEMGKNWSAYQKRILENLQRAEKRFEKKHRCMYPGCNEWAISSHSQQNRGQLASIAENGDVIAMSRSVLASIVQSDAMTPPPIMPSPTSVNKATTFLGFCNKHDTSVFYNIEHKPLVKGSPDQVLAFHRRAVAYEMWNKQKQIAVEKAVNPSLLVDKECLLKADEAHLWKPLWEADPIADVDYEWLVLDRNIGISLTTCIPCLDDLSFASYMRSFWNGDTHEYETSRPCFTLSICPELNKTHIVMCWRKKDNTNVMHCRSRLLCPQSRASFLNECIFVKSEDYCLRPSLWNGLPTVQRDLIARHLRLPTLMAETPIVLTDEDVA